MPRDGGALDYSLSSMFRKGGPRHHARLWISGRPSVNAFAVCESRGSSPKSSSRSEPVYIGRSSAALNGDEGIPV
jgi:hypothetical protein